MQTFEIYNPNRPKSVIFFRGLYQKGAEQYKAGSFFHSIVDVPGHTVVFINWPSYDYIPELSAAQLEDLCITFDITRPILLGSSYGGYAALDFIADIKRNKVPLNPIGLITLMSPVSAENLTIPRKLLKSLSHIGIGLIDLQSKITKKRLSSNRSDLARRKSMRNHPFSKEELIDMPVLAVATHGEPLLGRKLRWLPDTPDLTINNKKAALDLQGLFTDVKILEVEGSPLLFIKDKVLRINSLGAHTITPESWPLVIKTVTDFIQSRN